MTHPYMPHELDAHPDRERIEATIEEAVKRRAEEDADDSAASIDEIQQRLDSASQVALAWRTAYKRVTAAATALVEQIKQGDQDE